MRKRINLILVICLVAVVACTLFACNKDGSEYVDKVPEVIGVDIDPGTEFTDVDGGVAIMQYSFTQEVSSILHSIIIDPEEGFDITSVNYSIVYRKGAQSTVTNEKPLSIDYVDEADRPLLKQSGFHTIHTSVPYRGKLVKGSFTMRLKYEYEEVEYVDLTFNTDGGIPHFATATNNIAKTTVEKGMSYSYDEFIRAFTITKAGQAIKNFTVEGNPVKTLSRTASASGSGTSSSITITGKTTFTVHWTANTVKVKFDINAPTTSTTGSIPEIPDQDVEQSVGTVQRPALDMNLFNGYLFAGWYDKSNNSAWNFTTPAGQKDINLYAKWTIRYYETTIYPMSSTFKTDIKNSVSAKGSKAELKTIDAAKADGYTIATCDVVFNASTNNVLSVDISGLTYGKPYSDYAAEVRIRNTNNAGDKRIIILSELFDAFEKVTADEDLNELIVTDGFYSSQACRDEEEVDISEKILGNKVLYVKWNLNLESFAIESGDSSAVISEKTNGEKQALSSFITNVLYKNSYEIKADGSVKLIDIKDETFCDIIIPDTVTIDGTDRYITEFASKAAMNVRSLGKLDLSRAEHLEAIGSEAFINCSNLYEIVWPTENNIEKIGRKAFKNTAFENEYPTNFIVINDILYKFIDKAGNTREVDMLTCDEKDDLVGVKKIADNAFADALLLEKVTLSENVEEIGDNAFLNLEILKQVNAGDKLYKVSATAFSETALIKEMVPAATNNTVYLKDNLSNNVPAVKVGNVLVKVLDEYITSLRIDNADNITAFADEALALCKDVDELTVASYSTVKYIGKDAFSALVPFLQKQTDGFLIINGILSDYFNKDYNFYDAVIPSTVKTISSYAFNSYARYLKTIEIGSNVESIDEYAFAGASALKSLLFSKVTADSNGFYNLPAINPRSFYNSEGKLINGLNFYFYKSAMDRFAQLETSGAALTETEEAWMNLYKQNKDSFHVEKIEKVYVNEKEVGTIYVRPAGAYTWPSIPKGIILESNAGVKKYETLTSAMLDPFVYGTEGIHVANIKENLDWGTKKTSASEEGTEYVPFTYRVIFQVAGNPDFYTLQNKSVIDGNSLLKTGNYYISGFEGDVEGASVPTFFTTRSALDLEEIQFCYKTAQTGSAIHKISAIEYSDFAPNANNTSTIYFTFDFYGAGIYKVAIQYKGVEPKVSKIEQAGPISIPLNADVRAALSSSEFIFYGEDGIEESTTVDMNEFEIISVNGSTDNLSLDSNTLGLNTVVLRYRGSRKAVSELQNVTVVYSVVLEGDPSQFTFEIKKNKAIITSHSNKNIETLVIPSSYVKDGTEYPVTEIGTSVFANYQNLVTVYLPATIERIMDSAFSGCSLLEKVYSSESTENVKTEIGDADFDILTSKVVKVGHVNIVGYDATSGTIVIPSVVTYEEAERDMGTYKEKATVNAIPTLTEAIFDTFVGTVYLDYTAENYDFIKTEILDKHVNTINGIHVVFMFSSLADVSSVDRGDDLVSFLPYNDTNIAFVEDEVKNAGEDGLEENYLYYYVISDSQPRKLSTAQRHFTIDESSFIEEERYVERTRRLKSFTTVAAGKSIIIVGDQYESEYIDGGVSVYAISTTTATVPELTYSGDSFMVYLPDTIFNTCIIKNSASMPVETIVYKHGEELLYSTNEYIPSSLQHIGSSVFSGCISLKTIDFTKATSLGYIGANAFSDSGIVSLDLSETIITEINGSTFKNCKSLTTVIIPSTVKFIGSYAFDSCANLNLPKEFFANIEEIDQFAFTVCTNFKDIDLTLMSATSVGSQAFSIEGATVKVAFAEGNKPAGWAADWYGICDVEYNA